MPHSQFAPHAPTVKKSSNRSIRLTLHGTIGCRRLGENQVAGDAHNAPGFRFALSPLWFQLSAFPRFSFLLHTCPLSSAHSPARNPRGKTGKSSWPPLKGRASPDRPAQIQTATQSQGVPRTGPTPRRNRQPSPLDTLLPVRQHGATMSASENQFFFTSQRPWRAAHPNAVACYENKKHGGKKIPY